VGVAKFVVCHLPVLLVTSLLTCGGFPTDAATTRPGVPAVATIEEDILLLGDPDPRIREAATRRLADAGAQAEAQLREAAADGHPETALRARWLLTAVEFALPVDTPLRLRAKLLQYQNADANGRIAIGREILDEDTEAADAVVAAMWSMTPNGPLVSQIEQRLAQRYERVCRGMIYRGNDAGAQRLLDLIAARNSQPTGFDWAAFHVATGRDAEALQRLIADPSPENFRLQVYLHRAAGRPEDALAAARASGNQYLVENMLYETARWAELADHLDAVENRAGVPDFTFRAATRRRAQPDRDPPAIEELPRPATAAESWFTIKALLLADCVDRATDFAVTAGNYAAAVELRCQQYRFHEAIGLLDDARAKLKPGELRSIEARLVLALFRNGLAKVGKARLDALRQAALASGLFEDQLGVVGLAVELRDPDTAWADAERFLEAAPDDNKGSALVKQLIGGDLTTAGLSWHSCRKGNSDFSPVQTLRKVRELLDGKVPRDEVDRWLAALPVEGAANRQDVPRHLKRLRDELLWAHRFGTPETAIQRAQAAATDPAITAEPRRGAGDNEQAIRDLLLAAGEVLIATGQYSDAATVLNRPAGGFAAAVIYNRGWCLARAGDEPQGQWLMDLAPRLAMADATQHAKLIEAMTARGDLDAAKRQRATFVRTGAFRSWHLGNALRDLANDDAIRNQFLQRADLYDRWYLDTTDTSTSFNNASDFPAIAALIHGLRAKAYLASGDVDRAVAEARLCLLAAPGRTDDLIDLVVRFDATGHNKPAEALFDEGYSILSRHRDAFPDEGQPHNAIAWYAALCNRRLDDALRDAHRAVAIEPDNAAFIDTLAEVHYRHGHVDEAVTLIDKALTLRPDMDHLKKQRQRFTGGADAK
jgi:hypothetical protein